MASCRFSSTMRPGTVVSDNLSCARKRSRNTGRIRLRPRSDGIRVAGDPPSELVALLAAVADDVRPTTFERELSFRVAYAFHAAIPDAAPRMLPVAGHAHNLEQPDR